MMSPSLSGITVIRIPLTLFPVTKGIINQIVKHSLEKGIGIYLYYRTVSEESEILIRK